MKRRQLGRQGLEVSAIGLGCMGMSDFYGGRDETEAEATIHRALDLGCTFLDTADMYWRPSSAMSGHPTAPLSASTAAPTMFARPARQACAGSASR